MQTASREKKVLAMCSDVSGRLLLLFAVGLAIDPLTASGAGRTNGPFGVSPSGSSTYSIPIWTPPGLNGVQPSISIDYSSVAVSATVNRWMLNEVTNRNSNTYILSRCAPPASGLLVEQRGA